jgi:hypothetical protein
MVPAMPVSLPERTVDAWVTAYIVGRVPAALLWAPTQRQDPDYDIASTLPELGKLFVLEDKAPYTNGGHGFDLEVRQMWNYLRNSHLRARTFYVLPCPPFPVSAVPGAPGAVAQPQPDLIPRRALARRQGHPWPQSQGCEHWFRVVSVVELWNRFLRHPLPAIGFPVWPKHGEPPDATIQSRLPLTCPLPADLGESLKTFMDGLIRCDRPELRVEQGRPNEPPADGAGARDGDGDGDGDGPPYQALITYVPKSSLTGW